MPQNYRLGPCDRCLIGKSSILLFFPILTTYSTSLQFYFIMAPFVDVTIVYLHGAFRQVFAMHTGIGSSTFCVAFAVERLQAIKWRHRTVIEELDDYGARNCRLSTPICRESYSFHFRDFSFRQI
jgi:hypothetical protein